MSKHNRKVMENGAKQAAHLDDEVYDILGQDLHLVPLKNHGEQKPITGTSGKEGDRVEIYENDLIGVMLGQSNLLSIDLDCEEAQKLWPNYFPQTLSHGRKSKPVSHIWFSCAESKEHSRKAFSAAKATVEGEHSAMFVELRCGPNWNRIPPSMHKSGEKLVWGKTPLEAMSYDDAIQATGKLAAACLLLRKYPESGSRNDYAMYLSGYLAKNNFPEVEAMALIETIAAAAGDEEIAGRKSTVEHTYRELEAGQPVAGYTGLVKYIDTADVDHLADWLGFAKYNGQARRLELNDNVHANRFIELAGSNVCFVKGCDWWGFSEDMGYWLEGDSVAYDYAKQAAKSFENDPTYELDARTREALKNYANGGQNVARINSCLAIAERHIPLQMKMDQFNPDGHLLNVLNGTVDLRTGICHDHDAKDLITKIVPVQYNPDAQAPEFLKGLRNMLRDDDMVQYMINVLGSALVNCPDRRKIYFLVSGPKGGKTTLINILRGVLGPEYHTVCSREVLLATGKKDGSGPKHQLADLFGKRVITCEELGEQDLLDGEQIKQMTGNGYIKADKKFRDSFEFRLEGTFFVATNFRVYPKNPNDAAFWERARLIEFQPIEKAKIIKGFETMLLDSEKEGILNLLVQGAGRFIANKYEVPNMPDCVVQSTKDLEEKADTVGSFIRDRVKKKKGSDLPKSWVYDRFKEYCDDKEQRYQATNVLSSRLKLAGFADKNHGSNGVAGRVWLDIEIVDADGKPIEWSTSPAALKQAS